MNISEIPQNQLDVRDANVITILIPTVSETVIHRQENVKSVFITLLVSIVKSARQDSGEML